METSNPSSRRSGGNSIVIIGPAHPLRGLPGAGAVRHPPPGRSP